MRIHLLAAVLIAAAAASVQADPCDKDRALTCSDTKAGDGRIHDCLIGRKDQLAPSCAHALARADELANSMITACEPEAHRWCAQYGADLPEAGQGAGAADPAWRGGRNTPSARADRWRRLIHCGRYRGDQCAYGAWQSRSTRRSTRSIIRRSRRIRTTISRRGSIRAAAARSSPSS